jgi:hypothetical protein
MKIQDKVTITKYALTIREAHGKQYKYNEMKEFIGKEYIVLKIEPHQVYICSIENGKETDKCYYILKRWIKLI